ncbi:unnamed protein product [Cylindrotheca closterium]|uniref:Uncharacterized protein n=1 Tax=Cylindrotheca closterium TaxID=2856 RepID=A0AAD2FZF8_9STRA|nr:unnamed protein product [Cylindrotheca closterium]
MDAEQYGYGAAAPTTAQSNAAKTAARYEYDPKKQPRRSSLKGSDPDKKARRSTIGCASTNTVEVKIRGQRVPVIRRRSIDFARSVRVKEVTPVASLANKEDELWLQGEDFKAMKEERKKIVRNIMNNKGGDPTAIRGLEKYVDKTIRQSKQVAWDTVFIEQDEQEMAGLYSPEKLAEVYKHYTRESPHKAVERAKEDEKQVQDYMSTPRTKRLMMRRLSC